MYIKTIIESKEATGGGFAGSQVVCGHRLCCIFIDTDFVIKHFVNLHKRKMVGPSTL